MQRKWIDTLESRTLLSSGTDALWDAPFATAEVSPAPASSLVTPALTASKKASKAAKKHANPATVFLSTTDVSSIIAAAASQAKPTQAIAVVDREAQLLGLYLGSGLVASEAQTALSAVGQLANSIQSGASAADINSTYSVIVSFLNQSVTAGVVVRAISRAVTAAQFESREDAFTTRTARFIIQDNFPFPIRNTPGGPLYGVEFSRLLGSDVILPKDQSAVGLGGDPGGIPLYTTGIPVGGIGVAGDLKDTAPKSDFVGTVLTDDAYGRQANPNRKVFNGKEEKDFDESVALTGARQYRAPDRIKATNIFVDGLRFPFTASARARGNPSQTLDQLVTSGAGQLITAPEQGLTTTLQAGEPERKMTVNDIPALLGPTPTAAETELATQLLRDFGPGGAFRITTNKGVVNAVTGQVDTGTFHADPQEFDAIREGTDKDSQGNTKSADQRLSKEDVLHIILDAEKTALNTRALIRKPNGVAARVHIVVCDTNGTVLGAFRMEDGTNFSYDVAVQKARTAAFFSDDTHAFTPRAIGFMAQKYFPAGLATGVTGPLFTLQDKLSLNPADLSKSPLPNGITIFPGGVPLYKNGVLVGGLGISGDGVDQDDIIAFGGGSDFQPRGEIRSDHLGPQDITDWIISRLQVLESAPGVDLRDAQGRQPSELAAVTLPEVREFRLPYVKFPRKPGINKGSPFD